MSIAFGGLIALAFRGANVLIAFGLVVLTSSELGGAGRGTYVLGVTVVGTLTAVAGGVTTAAAYQVSNQRRDPVTVRRWRWPHLRLPVASLSGRRHPATWPQ